jgi:hypothetical protein
MVGRESRGRPGSHRVARRSWIRRDGPGGTVRGGVGSRDELDPETRETALDEGGSYGACSVVDLFSETALGEPFTAAEGG